MAGVAVLEVQYFYFVVAQFVAFAASVAAFAVEYVFAAVDFVV